MRCCSDPPFKNEAHSRPLPHPRCQNCSWQTSLGQQPPSGLLTLQSCLPQGHPYNQSAHGWKSHPSFTTSHGVGSTHHRNCITIQLPFLPLFSLPCPSPLLLFPSLPSSPLPLHPPPFPFSSPPRMLTPEAPPNWSPTCQSLSQHLILREHTCDIAFDFSSVWPGDT